MTDRDSESETGPEPSLRAQAERLLLGLPARLLGLTIAFVMLAEVLIFLPSAAGFRLEWMTERVESGVTASLAVEAAPDRMVSEELARELLMYAEVEAIAIKRGETRELILAAPGYMPERMKTVDLRAQTWWSGIRGVIAAYGAPPDLTLRLIDNAHMSADAEFIEVLVPQAPLKRDLIAYSWRIFGLSILISLIAASLIYLSLTLILVRPIRRLSRAMTRFRDDPENASLITEPTRRRDEIGEAERAFADMQQALRHAMAQRARLAALGAAVSRIAHDLRNILTSAQLVSDRLAHEEDPRVRKMGERLVRAVTRGVALTEGTLKYGKAEERPPAPQTLGLRAALEEAATDAGLFERDLDWRNETPAEAEARFDPEHLHRILVNLLRNGAQAMEDRDAAALSARTRDAGGHWAIAIADTGPGVPAKARARLFEPFGASGSNGGAGLGLSIARELARANGGEVRLAESGSGGAVFEVDAPKPGAGP